MTTITLPFGEATVTAELPDRARVVSRGGGAPGTGGGLAPIEDLAGSMREALDHPLGLPPIRDLVRPGSRVVIAFDDPTVTSFGPVRRIAIEAVLAQLADAGVSEEDVSLICANALHRKFTRAEMATVIGQALVDRFGERLFCHDAEDAGSIVNLGVTARGYDVELSRHAAEADLCVYVNAGLHLGFSGGWKSVAVGLSTWRSIRHTHHPDGMSMSVLHNRMHDVLDEMGAHIETALGKRIYKIECVLASPAKVARVWAGGVRETRAAALELMAARNPPRRSQSPPADVVLYGVPAWSPYAVFGRMNPILTLISSGMGYLGGHIEALGKPGCTVILATPCPETWDMEHHPSYRDAWDRVLPRTRDPYEIMRRFGEEFATDAAGIERYRFGVAFHPVHAVLATHPLRRLKHAARVIVAGPEDAAVPAHVGFGHAPTVEEALREAQRRHGADCSIVCVN
ncbi:MAG TPA: lactate racemase domain-containing protein [Dehalococcoidia bacterium]|nr:lactate racemase domain-containing protein [Dehalococcoidia bacterium]